MIDYPLVIVEWGDAWYDADEITAAEFRVDYPVETVGYLVREEEGVVSVAQESLEVDGMFRAVTHIPRPMVMRITYLTREDEEAADVYEAPKHYDTPGAFAEARLQEKGITFGANH